MYVHHQDSTGRDHYFCFRSNKLDTLQRIARKMSRRTNRVLNADTPQERDRAYLKESATIARYESYCGITVDEWNGAPRELRFYL